MGIMGNKEIRLREQLCIASLSIIALFFKRADELKLDVLH